ncbi:MAG TPA: YcbK family protein [Candidatus Binatus sp.]|nr:YcbK family protein [Candidatus Binatus sp.]
MLVSGPCAWGQVGISRRNFLKIGAVAATQLVLPAAALARTTVQLRRRSLKFYALHTGESLTTTYWENGHYIPGELDRVNYILRDFRANEVKPIDPALLDLLTRIQYRLDTNESFQVISGYRSPVTNAMLHANSEGVAVHSLHIDGKAIDISVPGRSLEQLRGAALAQRSGGVGYYPKTGFVHVDTGRVRHW